MLLLLLLAFFVTGNAQSSDPVLDAYIQEAIKSNHGLKEQQFLLEKNRLALEEARRMFLPEIGFGASYTLATGGRTIQIPVGDLMNPVYATLNQLTQTSQFPQIDNVEEQFFPNNFYDARVRITQPILNRSIHFNRKIKQETVGLIELEIQQFKRELVRDVKTAYYRVLQTRKAVQIYDNALELLTENQRLNESLLRNDKIIPSVLSRIENEIAKVNADRNQAIADRNNAAAYLNFLLNRDLDTPVDDGADLYESLNADNPVETALSNREEIQRVLTARNISSLVTEMERSYKIPRVGAQLDIGSQNFDFEYGGYILGGLSVEIPVWAAGRNDLQVRQAELDELASSEKLNQVKKQIELQTRTLMNDLQAERSTLASFETQLEHARRQYRDTFRRYSEGVSNYLELLDARTQVTTIELQQSLALFNVLVRQAELERALATYPLP